MKKLALSVIVLAGLALLASCKKDNDSTNGVFKASIEQQNQNGKTAIDTTGTEGVITWSEGDEILISNGSDSETFTLQTGEGTTNGTFSTAGALAMTGNYTAAYPATASIDGTTVTFSLPATQTMANGESGTFANGANPMVAVANGTTNLAFKNPCGGLGIRLKGATEGITVTNIRIIGGSDDILWGNLTVTMDGVNVDTTSIANTATGKNIIDLTCNVTLSKTEAKRFFIVLPEGALQHGFTLEVSYGAAEPYSKSTGDTDIAQVQRNTMKSLNAITIGTVAPVVTLPAVTTTDVTSVTTNSAVSGGENIDGGGTISEYGICWNTTGNPTIEDDTLHHLGEPLMTDYTFTMTGLDENTTYHVRAYVINEVDIAYGDVKHFTTKSYSYTVNTGTAVQSPTDPFTYTLNGSFSETLSKKASHVGFYYGTNHTATLTKVELGMPTTDTTFNTTISSLDSGTTYYYKAYLENNGSEICGSLESFTTLSVPTVTTVAATNITGISATCGGTVTSDGNGNLSAYGIRYSTDPNMATGVTSVDGTNYDSGNYTATLTGLTINTTYYYCAYANNEAGIGCGDTLSFKTIIDLTYLTQNLTAQDGDVLTGTLAGNYKISVNTDNATITLRGATINGNNNSSFKWAGITCQDNTTIVLEGTNTVKGFYEDYPGIHIATNKTLTIQGSGSLTASSNGYAAGIGGGYLIACGNIVINGGTINAIGGDGKNTHIQGAAGIGSGYNTSCGFISINNENGTVEATGGVGGGAGIGSGYKGICGNITIYDGTVTATGGYDAAGIGSGFNQYRSNACGMITINQGTITATGGYRAAGIGTGNVVAGQTPTCSGIFITGGNVEARGGDGGAGIGVGSLQNGYADCGGISISGGLVTAIGGGCAAGIGSGCVHRDNNSISTCGDISITGGTVIATGGAANDTYQGGAGIGTGSAISSGGYTGYSNCGNITIANTVTSVTATKGSGAQNSIGKNHSDNPGTCGTITIGGTVTGNISISPYTYQP